MNFFKLSSNDKKVTIGNHLVFSNDIKVRLKTFKTLMYNFGGVKVNISCYIAARDANALSFEFTELLNIAQVGYIRH